MTAPLNSYNWDASTQFPNLKAAYAAMKAGTGRCAIAFTGDSTTAGVGGTGKSDGSVANVNYAYQSGPGQVWSALNALGIPATFDSFFGDQNDPTSDSTTNATTPKGRITLSASGSQWSGAQGAGGPVCQITSSTGYIQYDLLDGNTFDHVDVDIINVGGSVDIALDGGAQTGSPHTFASAGGNMDTFTFAVARGAHTSVRVYSPGGGLYLQGIRCWDSVSRKIEIYKSGSGGSDSSPYNGSAASGYGLMQGIAVVKPAAVFINIGINDLNNGSFSKSSYKANLLNGVKQWQGVGIDVILVVPTPINNSSAETSQPDLVAALQEIAVAQNVPVINLHDRYVSYATQAAKSPSWMFNNLHPAAPLYADEGAFYAQTIQGIVGATGGTNTDFPVSAGAFSVSGQSAAFASALAVAPAVFNVVGQAALLALMMAGSPGAFAATGSPASFEHVISAAPGAYAVGGQAPSFASALTTVSGAYALTGSPAAFAGTIAGSLGAYSVAGQPASFADALPIAPGSFVITGHPATFVSSMTGDLIADPGAYIVTGQPASFASSLNAAPATFTLAGQPATFSTGVLAAAGGYAFAGRPVAFEIGMPLPATPFAITGNPAVMALRFNADAGSYAITGQVAAFYGSLPQEPTPASRTVTISFGGTRAATV